MYKLTTHQFKAINKALNPHNSGDLINAVNARDIHAYLCVGRDFSNWIKQRIKKYDFVEGIDFVVVAKTGDGVNSGFQPIEYHLSPDMTKQLAMVENNTKGREVRIYYLDLEKRSIAKLDDNKIRAELRCEYRPMTTALINSREGKEINPYHFSNEADLINRITLGSTASKFRVFHDIAKDEPIRDYLTIEQKHCLLSLQRANTVYLLEGLGFDERKERLNTLYNRQHKTKLIDEQFRLCA